MNLNFRLVSRDFRPLTVPTPQVARAMMAALLRHDSPLLDDLISAFLSLSHDRGGYGVVVASDSDIAALRAVLVHNHRAVLEALNSLS